MDIWRCLSLIKLVVKPGGGAAVKQQLDSEHTHSRPVLDLMN